ncbi:Spore germination endopeptidase Gpr [Candidatus Syntrophocurvum alkaliphilum]|uniref:Germination protease n=1 Tax=Candidatus Syntrophocurvum alkaliphilum TaxID=2293317 RepID=A0A6I6D7G6_9FIRM|nr:GPR endopeptidase [Candidatus Syntrophocurvum alkaliphilum]QGT99076.1 Spore germination endopeptidase Gpr [Candidatus Syntrophocurvum alkaliphilum]
MNDFLNYFSLNVDLAVEARDIVRGKSNIEVSGVEEEVENLENIDITTITIMNEEAASVMGKPMGTYVTIESPPLKINNPYVKEEIITAMSKSLTNMVPNIAPDSTILLVGLGNWHATPDALGPKFIEYSPITRHYHQYAPQALVEGMRPSCGIAPGVLGVTGLETFEVIKGIVEKVNPAMIVVVDALAAQNVDRIGTTIQMSNTGIQPGAGIGNNRHALNQEGLGVPVIAIGCPTIVNAAVIANQAIKNFCLDSGAMYNENQSTEAIKTTLSHFGGSLSVTPKEIDDIVENTSRIMAMGVGHFLFPGISTEQLELYAI